MIHWMSRETNVASGKMTCLSCKSIRNVPLLFVDFNNYYDMEKALNEGKIDRFLFPDYKDLIWLLDNVYKERKEKYKIAKVFESPFQVGMVLSMVPEFISADDNVFLRCLRTGISARERWVSL